MAAIFALSLVPTGALASGSDSGDLATTEENKNVGTITIQSAKANETYSVYRMFELASFKDDDNSTGVHVVTESGNITTNEAYSYVIDENSPWYGWLTTNPSGNAYAVQVGSSGDDQAREGTGQLFWIQPEKVELTKSDGSKTAKTYHVIYATSKFDNAFDVSTSDRPYATTDYDDATNAPKVKVIQDFAQAALAYAKGSAAATQLANYTNPFGAHTYSQTDADHDGTIVIADAPLGYYLMGTTMGTLASLDTNNRTVTIYEKNQEPQIEKKVLKKGVAAGAETADHLILQDGETDAAGTATNWVEDTDADVNDLVQFRTVITAQQGAKGYKLHDAMEKGLTFVGKEVVTAPANTNADRYVGGSTGAATDPYAGDYGVHVYLVRNTSSTSTPSYVVYKIPETESSNTNWTLTIPNASTGDGCDFELALNDAVIAGKANNATLAGKDSSNETVFLDVKDGDQIVVTYWARLNDQAVIYGDESFADDDAVAEVDDNSKTTVKDNVTPTGATLKEDDGSDTAQKYTLTDGNNRNTNSTILVYGQKSHTTWDRAEVTTYQLDIAKTAKGKTSTDGTSKHLLAGAEFELYKAAPSTDGTTHGIVTNGIQYVPTTGGTAINSSTVGTSAPGYYQTSKALSFDVTGQKYLHRGDPATAVSTATTTITTDGSNVVNVEGLEEGWYMLVETKAPDGYNKLSNPVLVYVNGDKDYDADQEDPDLEGKLGIVYRDNNGQVTDATAAGSVSEWKATMESGTSADPTKYQSGGVHVLNQAGQELPSTGGIGTTIFYVAGTVLVLGAVVMLVAKRRMGAEA